jgi:hypothetical protein
VAEQLPDRPSAGHPVAAGLVALVGVAVVVGLILGLVVLAGSRVLGLGGDDSTSRSGSERSMYLPKPEKTPMATDPQITLAPAATASADETKRPDEKDGEKPSKAASPRTRISLSSSSTTASPMQTIDLSGVYPGGEGAILTVQRFENGAWQDFPAPGSVSNETFQIPVQTSKPGVNRFRVVDTDTGRESNEVRITIG